MIEHNGRDVTMNILSRLFVVYVGISRGTTNEHGIWEKERPCVNDAIEKCYWQCEYLHQ